MNQSFAQSLRMIIYILAGFGLYGLIKNGWITFFTLLIVGGLEGYIWYKLKV